MQKGEIVEMIYLSSGDGKLSKRCVHIVSVTDAYVRAYCYSRRGFRIFKKENILACRTVRRVS